MSRIGSCLSVGGCIALVSVYCFWNLTPETIHFTNDAGISFAVARSLLSGDFPLAGPPSHVGGRHLGPIYYWYVALTLVLTGGHVYGAVLLQTLLKAIALVSSLLLLRRLFEREKMLWPMAISFLFLISGSYAWPLRVPWHGNFVILPSAFALFATYRVLASGARGIPLFLLAVSLLIQTQLASAPMAFALSAVVFFQLLISGELRVSRLRRWGPSELFIFVLLLVSWLPTAVYEAQFDSNLARLFNVHSGHSQNSAGYAASAVAVAKGLREYTIGALGGSLLSDALVNVLQWCVLIMCVLSALHYVRVQSGVRRAFVIALLLILVAYQQMFSFLSPPLHLYYLHSVLPVILLVGGISFGHAASITGKLGRGGFMQKLLALPLAFGMSVALLSSVVNAYHHTQTLTQAYSSRWENLKHVETVGRTLAIIGNDEGAVFKVELPSDSMNLQQSLRLNAYYYFSGSGYDFLMDQAPAFIELASFSNLAQQAPVRRAWLSCGTEPENGLSDRLYVNVDGCELKLLGSGPKGGFCTE